MPEKELKKIIKRVLNKLVSKIVNLRENFNKKLENIFKKNQAPVGVAQWLSTGL